LQLANPPDAGPENSPLIGTARVSQDATGAAKYLEIRWTLSQDGSLSQDTIFDVATGSVVNAIRNDIDGCYAPFDVATQSAALLVQSVTTGNIFFGQGTVRNIFAPPSFECVWTTPPGSLNFMQEHAISDTTFAFDTTDYTVFRTNTDGGWAATYQAGSQGAQLGLLLDFVAKDDVYAFTNDNGFQREYLVQPDGTPVLYRGVANRFVTAVATDGTTMFWTESFGASTPGGTPTSFEAWAAPYTNDPATLEATAHRVAVISGNNPPNAATAAAGLYAIGSSVTNLTLVRLSDGAIHNFMPASSNPLLHLFDVTYVSPSEIWVIVKTDQLTTNYLRRYDLGTW
jgi:hypothetical protein